MPLPGLNMLLASAVDLVSGFTVSVYPTSLSGTHSYSDGLDHTIGTGLTTATPAGGSGSYTYAWTTGGVVTASAPSSASCGFSATLSPDDRVSDTATITVTDTATGAKASASVPVTLHYVSLL